MEVRRKHPFPGDGRETANKTCDSGTIDIFIHGAQPELPFFPNHASKAHMGVFVISHRIPEFRGAGVTSELPSIYPGEMHRLSQRVTNRQCAALICIVVPWDDAGLPSRPYWRIFQENYKLALGQR